MSGGGFRRPVRSRKRCQSDGLGLSTQRVYESAADPDMFSLVHRYIERGSPKAEPAARRWLVRYLSEGSPSLRDVAKVTASLAEARSKGAG